MGEPAVERAGALAWCVARAPACAGWLLVGAILAVNVFRAATQSIVHDEALTYQAIVSRPWAHVLSFFDANHHILSSYLIKLSVDAFGLSEISLRLTSLVAGALYLVAALRLNLVIFGARWLTLFPLALMTLDPAVMDFMSAARGYGPALALLVCAILLMVQSLAAGEAPSRPGTRWRMLGAGALLGLSAAANLAHAIPGAAFTVAFAAIAVGRATRSGERPMTVLRAWVAWMVAPGLAVFVPLVAPPLLGLKPGTFYVGAETLGGSLHSLLAESFSPRDGLLEAGAPASVVSDWMMGAGPAIVIGVLGVVAAVLWARGLRRHEPAGSPDERCRPCRAAVALLGLGMLLALALMVLAHAVAGLRYPEGRSGIYALPLLALCSLCLVEAARGWPRAQRLAFAGPVVGFWTVALLLYGLNFDPTQYRTWAYDRSSRRYVELIRAEHATAPDRIVRVGVTWLIEPSFNFYRQSLDLRWMAPATRAGLIGAYDYFVFWRDDRRNVRTLGLREIARDDVAETILAAAVRPPMIPTRPGDGRPAPPKK